MIKTRTWPVKAMYLLIAMALAVSLAMIAAPPKVSADPGFLTEWTKYSTPAETNTWKIAACSQIFHYGGTAGGENMYAVGEGRDWADIDDDGSTTDIIPQLWKTTDSANSWKSLSDKVQKEAIEQGLVVDINDLKFLKVSVDPMNADFMAVAFSLVADPYELHVFVSETGGSIMKDSGDIEDGLSLLTEMMFLTISQETDGDHNLAVSGIGEKDLNDNDVIDIGADPDEEEVGLVFRFETGLGAGWEDATQYDGWDNQWNNPMDDPDPNDNFLSVVVPYVWFAGSFPVDNTVMVTSITAYPLDYGFGRGCSPQPMGEYYLQTGTWGNKEGWNQEVTFSDAVLIIDDVFVPALGAATAGITLPADYAGRHISKRYGWLNIAYVLDEDPTDMSEFAEEEDRPMGEIYRFIDDAAAPILQQVKDYPWLASARYWGFIDEGKALASLMYSGVPEWNPFCDAFTPVKTDCCEGVQVYRNDSVVDMDICCKAWKASCKPPTGRTACGAFFVSDKKAYAVVGVGECYDESAWSVSFDDGKTWNQLSLIDTHIDFFSDVAKSPNCNKTMLVSVNLDDCGYSCEEYDACDSTWMKADDLKEAEEYDGVWFRTWCGLLAGDYGLLRLAPEEQNGETVYLVDWMTDTVYWNNNETLACWEEGHSTISSIYDLAVKDEATIYALDENADVAVSDDHGATATWDDPVDSKVSTGHTIAVLGDNVFVGGAAGKVSYSTDAGETYTKLAKKTPAEGNVHIAADTYYTDNKTIYGADRSGGIYRWVIDESHQWHDLNAINYGYTGIVTSPFHNWPEGNPMTDAAHGGVLYASYPGGVARALTPAATPCCLSEYWDYLTYDLPGAECFTGFYAEPSALRICGCLSADTDVVLWALDFPEYGPECDFYQYGDFCGRLWYFTDCFTKAAPTLLAPADGATIPADPCICTNDNFMLKWDRLCEACAYDIYIAKDPSCATEIILKESCYNVPSGASPSYVLMEGDLDCATTYYWRVRVCEAETGQTIKSFKSDIWSFTVAAGPQAGVSLTSPDNGTSNVPQSNVNFTWTTVQNADSYDWVLSKNADLSSPVESKTGLTATANTATVSLDKDTSYYWQVTAKKGANVLDTSNVSTFTTAPAPPPPPPAPAEPTTPAWVWVVIGIGAVLVIVVIVLIFRTRRV